MTESLSIEFTIEGEVKGKMRPKATAFGGHARVYTPSAQIKNENWIKMEYLRKAESEGFKGFGDKPVNIYITTNIAIPKSFSKKKREQALAVMLRPIVKPDIDNVCKTILDALNGIAFDDDKQIVRLNAEKYYSEKTFTYVYMEEAVPPSPPHTGINPKDDILCL